MDQQSTKAKTTSSELQTQAALKKYFANIGRDWKKPPEDPPHPKAPLRFLPIHLGIKEGV